MPFVVGENIGPYRILEQLGRGGMATVFKAYHAALDRYVAIKALHPAFMEDPNFHARFQREARVVAKLEHPNIVPIYDFAEHESRPYLVMKYIEGDTLKARLTDGDIQQDELIEIVAAVGAGLSYAHKQGILHRDIKPSNVLLGLDRRIYLADFGLARIAQAGESTLSSDMMLGTPQYISPEQAMGLGELDERTDIYSFGVMLYEMSVGKVPFSADTPFSIIHDHIYTPLPLPSVVNPNVTAAVERVLLKALAKERDDRYSDANDLAVAFNEALLAGPGTIPVAVESSPEQTYISEPELEPETEQPIFEIRTESDALETVTPDYPIEETPSLGAVSAQSAASRSLPKKRKRRFRWWFIPLGIVVIVGICFCSLAGLGAVLDWIDNGTIDSPSAEQLPESPPSEPLQESRPSLDLEAPPLDEAQQIVEEDPEDPYAWFELALSHWQAGDPQAAQGALDHSLELAGDDPDFYYGIAEMLSEQEFWAEAAHVFLRGFLRFEDGKIPPDYIDSFHEAAYWAAEEQYAEKYIPISEIATVDRPMEQVTQARFQFYNGDENEAQMIIEEVLTRLKPGMPEAMYLQAEIFYFWGDNQASNDILRELQQRGDTPEWIRQDVEILLEGANDMIENAQAQIDANPDDPFLYLPLYEAYLGQGQYDQARGAIQQAFLVAGDNPEFAQVAGDVAARNGAWLDAARFYARSAQITPDEPRPELAEKFIQALYFGAMEESAPDVFGELEASLPDDDRGVLRGVYRDALIARYKLYYEDTFEAQALIESAVERAPNLPLPRLIQAEIYQWNGDFEASKAILFDLRDSRLLPPWMQEEVNWYLEEINP